MGNEWVINRKRRTEAKTSFLVGKRNDGSAAEVREEQPHRTPCPGGGLGLVPGPGEPHEGAFYEEERARTPREA